MNNEQLYVIKEAFNNITFEINELNQHVLAKFKQEMNITPISMNFVITWHDECILFYGDIPIWEYNQELHSNIPLKDLSKEIYQNLLKTLKGIKISYKMLQENVDGKNIDLSDYEDSFSTIDMMRNLIDDNSDILLLPTLQDKMINSKWVTTFGDVELKHDGDLEEMYGQIMAICEISKRLHKTIKKMIKENKISGSL